MPADVLKNFQNMSFEIYDLFPAHFLSASGAVWQAIFKETKSKLELLADIDM